MSTQLSAQNVRSALDREFGRGKTIFPKLQEKGEPYRFERWDRDQDGEDCLYYSFSSRDKVRRNVKRVPVDELAAAMDTILTQGVLTRVAFERV